MANTTKPLSDTEVKQAKQRGKEYNLGDGKGLFLRVKPTGSKLWIFNYSRPFTKRRANIGIGSYPDLSLSEARKQAQALRNVLANDVDPQEYRAELRRKTAESQANTFEHVARKWLALKQPNISQSYYDKIIERLELYIFPKMGKIPVHKVNAVTAIEIITPLAERGRLETVKKLCRWVNEIMTHAAHVGLIQINMLSGIGKAFNAPKVVNLPTLKPEQLPDFMRQLNQSRTKIVIRSLVEWQLHTMTRPGEAAGTRWDEIDRHKALWTIPAERMKKNRPHVIPLSPQALNLLEVLEPISGHRKFVFPSDHDPKRPANSQSANRAIKRMGFHGELVSHGLRALASTTLNEQGFDADVIEAALAHIDKNSIRAAYNRAQYLERRRVMMCWWSDRIEQASMGNLSVASRKHLQVVM